MLLGLWELGLGTMGIICVYSISEGLYRWNLTRRDTTPLSNSIINELNELYGDQFATDEKLICVERSTLTVSSAEIFSSKYLELQVLNHKIRLKDTYTYIFYLFCLRIEKV